MKADLSRQQTIAKTVLYMKTAACPSLIPDEQQTYCRFSFYSSAIRFTRFSPFTTAGMQMMITVIKPSASRKL